MKPSILPIRPAAAATPAKPAGWPLLRLGFQPFYLGAAVFAGLAVPLWLVLSLLGAALAWTTAFALYLAVFTPWLLSTRLDGQDG